MSHLPVYHLPLSGVDTSHLPLDIFIDVVAHCDHESLCALMSTCHALRDEVARRLIGEGVELRHERDIVSFVAYMFSKSKLYFAFLKELNIAAAPLSADSVAWQEALLRLLTHPGLSLEALCINTPEHLMRHEQIRTAFEHLSTITTLTLMEPGTHTWRMLEQFASPLVTVAISVVSDIRDTITPTTALTMNPVSRLARFLESLEKLNWHQEDQYGNPLSVEIPIELVTVRYPRLRNFRMYYNNDCPGAVYMAFPAKMPDARPYLAAFPNLRVFQLSHFPPTHKGFDTDIPPSLARRDLNRLAHETLERGPWPELVRCAGDLRSLFYLAHNGPVRTLQVRSCPATRWYLDKLRTVLEDTRPRVLDLQLLEWDILAAPQHPEDSVIEVLRTLPAHTVQSLRLELVLHRSIVTNLESIQREQIIDAFVAAFTNLPAEITTVEVYLDFQILTLIGGTLEDQASWDTLDIARRLVDTNPSRTLDEANVGLNFVPNMRTLGWCDPHPLMPFDDL